MVMAAVAALVALPGGPRTASAQGTVYTVTIQNLTGGQPFTPPLVVAHDPSISLWESGAAASSELQQIAENGNAEPMAALLKASSAVSSYTMGSGPVLPGQSVSLSIEVAPGDVISWVSMLICTNDGFTGINSFAVTGESTTGGAGAYDAGTEINTEDFADMVPPCQGLTPVGSDDAGTGMTNPDLAEGGVVAPHPGVAGGHDLTATHMWEGPVANVTVAPGGAISPPATGNGGLVGGSDSTLLYGAAALLAVLVAGGVVAYARQRS